MSDQSGSADQNTDGVGVSEQANEETSRNRMDRDLFKWKNQAKELERKTQELEEKLRNRELEEEEKKGNLSKVLDEYKEKTRNLESQMKQKDFTFARTNVINSLKQEAIKLGCKDPDAFVRLLGKEKVDVVSLDDSYTPMIDDVKMIVSEGMKQYEHIGLFGKDAKIVNGHPVTNPNLVDKPKTEQEVLSKYMKNKGW